jgi:hypothetical protein
METIVKVENPDVLDSKYYVKHCLCCGRKATKIWKFLMKQPVIENRQKWKGHTRHAGSNYFYDTNTCEYCESCGHLLDDEAIASVYESRGEFWGASCSEQVLTGYKCQACGFENKF